MGFSLGSFAGGLSQGYQSEQQIAMQKALQQQQLAGQTAAGNALGGTMAQPQPNVLQQIMQKLGAGTQPQQPAQMPGATPDASGGAPASPMGGSAMPTVGVALPPQQQGGAPQQPQQPPQQPQAPQQPSQGSAMGNLTLDNVVQRIKQFNPNIKPAELMAAVGQVLPIMNAQAQAQYKAILTQLAPAKLDLARESLGERTRHDKASEAAGQERIGQGDRRLDQGDARLAERTREFDTRQAATKERFEASLKEKYDALAATADRSQAVQMATDVRAAIRERFAATRAEISAANSFDPKQKKALMDEAAADRDAATARLDAALAAQKAYAAGRTKPEAPQPTGARPNGDGSKRTERAPTVTATPDGPRMLDDGTMLVNGVKWRYKGTGDRDVQENWEQVR